MSPCLPDTNRAGGPGPAPGPSQCQCGLLSRQPSGRKAKAGTGTGRQAASHPNPGNAFPSEPSPWRGSHSVPVGKALPSLCCPTPLYPEAQPPPAPKTPLRLSRTLQWPLGQQIRHTPNLALPFPAEWVPSHYHPSQYPQATDHQLPRCRVLSMGHPGGPPLLLSGALSAA